MRDSVLKFRDDFVSNYLEKSLPYTITKEQIIQLHPVSGGGLLFQRKTFQITKNGSQWSIENGKGSEISAVFQPMLNGFTFRLSAVYPMPFKATAAVNGKELQFTFDTPIRIKFISLPKKADGTSYSMGILQWLKSYTISETAAVMELQQDGADQSLLLSLDFTETPFAATAFTSMAKPASPFLLAGLPKLAQERLLSTGQAQFLTASSNSGSCGKLPSGAPSGPSQGSNTQAVACASNYTDSPPQRVSFTITHTQVIGLGIPQIPLGVQGYSVSIVPGYISMQPDVYGEFPQIRLNPGDYTLEITANFATTAGQAQICAVVSYV